VTAVALESTGVYWVVPHELLEQARFEVLLADTHVLRRVPGRPKSNRRDCEWRQRSGQRSAVSSQRSAGALADGRELSAES
jgi:transposase